MITTGAIVLKGSKIKCNPLPFPRDAEWEKPLKDGGLKESEQQGYRYMTGKRVLPYLVQDVYERSKQPMSIKTITLENDYIRAVFLPEYGGRLYSLYNKELGRELLYVNPVFQPANLAIRNAWFSGGIEWNIGQYGHTSLTCENVFFARCSDGGTDFLRMYEYERIKGFYLQIDFHLPENSRVLYAHFALHNSNDEPASLYYWTNTAVELNRNVRVLSGTSEVVLSLPSGGTFDTFCHDTLPEISPLPGIDATFCGDYPYSCEYFFQNPRDIDKTWEAAAYDDGSAFFERSTTRMPYRKMFCWSAKEGGRHWQEFLSEPGSAHYLEVQSGLYPSQVHGGDAEAKETVVFTQAFGGLNTDADNTHADDYRKCCDYAYSLIEQTLPTAVLLENDKRFTLLSTLEPSEILHFGGGWGALEARRQPGITPKGLLFPESTLGKEQEYWLGLLSGKLPAEESLPLSYMCDARWLPAFEKAAADGADPILNMHYALCCYENGQTIKALQLLAPFDNCDKPIVLYALAAVYKAIGNIGAALEVSERIQLCADKSAVFDREHITLLNLGGHYAKAWDYYNSLPDDERDIEQIRMQAAISAYETGHWDFVLSQFDKEFTTIREGESCLTDLWLNMNAKKLASQKRMTFEEAKDAVLRTQSPPYAIEFRTYTKY